MVFAVLALCLAGPASASAEVTLGAPAYSPPHGEGFGQTRPTTIYNGGVPSGLVTGIQWSSWGGPVAEGSGMNAIYKPIGGYYPQRAKIRLKATFLGSCPDHGPAYRKLLVRIPLWPNGPLGPWFSWGGDDSLCGDEENLPWSPAGGGGYCGYTGEYGAISEAKSILAVRTGCGAARAVAKRADDEVAVSPLGPKRRHCGRRGCRVRIHGFRCHFHPIRKVDFMTTSAEEPSPPLQRVACKRGRASVLFWYTHLYY